MEGVQLRNTGKSPIGSKSSSPSLWQPQRDKSACCSTAKVMYLSRSLFHCVYWVCIHDFMSMCAIIEIYTSAKRIRRGRGVEGCEKSCSGDPRGNGSHKINPLLNIEIFDSRVIPVFVWCFCFNSARNRSDSHSIDGLSSFKFAALARN